MSKEEPYQKMIFSASEIDVMLHPKRYNHDNVKDIEGYRGEQLTTFKIILNRIKE